MAQRVRCVRRFLGTQITQIVLQQAETHIFRHKEYVPYNLILFHCFSLQKMSPRIAALVALLALICVSAQAQNITRLLSSQYMYGGFDPSAFRPEQERKRFVFFFTPNVTAQTLDIAIAAPVRLLPPFALGHFSF